MKIKLSCIALCLYSTISLFAFGSKDTGVDNSLEKIQQKGVFVLGLDDSFPPLGFRNASNEIVGYDIDLAKEVAKRLGVTLKLQPIDWSAKEQELNTNKIDCIWNGFTITKERKEVINYTKPYLNNAQVIIVKKDAPFKTLEDLAGKRLALQAGSSSADALETKPAFKKTLKEVIEFKDYLTAFMDLERNGVDAILIDEVVARYNIKEGKKDFIVLEGSLTSEEFGIGFRKKDNQLRDIIQTTLEEMAKDGTISKISTKWFGKDISTIK
ncbi:MAG: amino acid ABC transporter substrate-binding protein [Treponemataceae bacterium]